MGKISRQDLSENMKLEVDSKAKRTDLHTVSVTRFGAKGDGIADDTLAIQEAFASGLDVLFPPGRFKITDTLVMDRPGMNIYGMGVDSTFIIMYKMNIPIVRVKTSNYGIDKLSLSYIAPQTEEFSGGTGIELGDAEDNTGAFEGSINHVIIYQPYRGIAIPTYKGSAFAFENTFTHVRVLDAFDTAFHLTSTGIGLTTNTFINCYALFQPNPVGRANGFHISNHDDFVMINCADDHGKNRALTVDYCRGGTVIDFHAEKCRLTEDYMSTIFINESVVHFTNLQVVYQIVEAPNESYMLFVSGKNSRVQIVNFAERDIEKLPGTFCLSVVNDGLGELIIQNAKYVSPVSVTGKTKINHHQWSDYFPPTVGTWNVGDIVWNKGNYWSSNVGWTCVNEGEFGTAKIPEFIPFGIIGNTYLQSNYDTVNAKKVDCELVASGYGYFGNFEVPGNFNQVIETDVNTPTASTWSIGASNESASNVGKFYKYALSVLGTGTQRMFSIFGFKNGSPDGVPIMQMSGEEINTFNIPFKNFRPEFGTTALRPTNPQMGSMYFDTTIKRGLWFDGVQWVDAMGSPR